MTVELRVGDTRELITDVADGSIALVATSPPFLALRSYLPADHDDKHAEIGSEPSPAAWLDTLLELTTGWGRVLSPWGSIAIELGDTYSGSGGAGGDYNDKGLRAEQRKFTGSAMSYRKAAVRNRPQIGWPAAKSLALLPQLYGIALAYGINPLTGQPSPAGCWLVRNVITWHRNNPAVGALGDKFRPSTSYIIVATRSKERWFDLTATRTPAQDSNPRNTNGVKNVGRTLETPDYAQRVGSNTAGAPPLTGWFDEHDTWRINTQPSTLRHYAMWPAKLAERLILSMCPESVCTTCGEPRRRIEHILNSVGKAVRSRNEGRGQRTDCLVSSAGPNVTESETLGWSDCGHDNYTAGTVLDPFAGTFTTGAVADLHHRHAIGFELNAHSASLYPQRRIEVARNLFNTTPELPGQQDLFEAIA